MVRCKTSTLGHMKNRIPESGEEQAAYSETGESEYLSSQSVSSSLVAGLGLWELLTKTIGVYMLSAPEEGT